MLKVDIRLSTIILLVILLSLFYADFFDVNPDKQDLKSKNCSRTKGVSYIDSEIKGIPAILHIVT